MTLAFWKKIDLFNNKFSFLFPILLATLLFGQIFFLIIYHYLNISRPAFWVASVLAVLLFARICNDIKLFRPTWLDICMGAFFAFVLISLFMHGQYSYQFFFKNYIGFMVFPFIAGRLMHKDDFKPFILTILFLTIVAAFIVSLGLFFIPEDEYNQDRISTLFWNYDSNFYGGIPTNIFAGFALAPLLILLHCPILKMRDSRFLCWLKLAAIFWCIWLLLIIAIRSAILSGLLFSIVAIVFFNYNNVKILLKKITILLSATLFSLVMLPEERTDFLLSSYGQLIQAVKKRSEYSSKNIEKEKPSTVPRVKLPEKSTLSNAEIPQSGVPKLKKFLPEMDCTTDCDSINVRYHLYLTALKMFKEKPVLGIGANNYVVYLGETSQQLSPHNLTLYIFLELGTVGGGLYLSIVGGLFFYFVRNINRNTQSPYKNSISVIFLLWGGILLMEQFSGNYFVTYQFYAMTGILISAYQRTLMSKQEILSNA